MAEQVATRIRINVMRQVTQVSEVLVHFDTSLRSYKSMDGEVREPHLASAAWGAVLKGVRCLSSGAAAAGAA